MAYRQTDTKPLPIMLTAQNNKIRWLRLYGKKSEFSHFDVKNIDHEIDGNISLLGWKLIYKRFLWFFLICSALI